MANLLSCVIKYRQPTPGEVELVEDALLVAKLGCSPLESFSSQLSKAVLERFPSASFDLQFPLNGPALLEVTVPTKQGERFQISIAF